MLPIYKTVQLQFVLIYTVKASGPGCVLDVIRSHCMFPNSKFSNKASVLGSSWNVKAHGDAREGKWRGNWRMEWVACTLHTTSEHSVSSITTADAHTSASSIRLYWRPPADLNGLVPFAERRHLVSARVPSHFKRSLPHVAIAVSWNILGFQQIAKIVEFVIILQNEFVKQQHLTLRLNVVIE